MQSTKTLERIERTLAAVKRSEMARLAALMSEKAARLREAEALRAQARQGASSGAASGLAEAAAEVRWQGLLLERASAAEAAAAEAERAAGPIRRDLARTVGRERAITGLIERNREAMARRADRSA